jgi:CheY-like chemotaxis protein
VGEGAGLAGLTVLVVEDHDDLRDSLRHFLSLAGAVVHTARDGLEALEVLESERAPDVILCDLHMPEMDGCEFVTHVREKAGFACIPVIALTGQSSDATMLRTFEAGFDAYLVKPVSGPALQAQIRRVLRR